MVYIFPGILIVLSLVGIFVIVFRKLPQLSTLDVETLPLEKEARKKKEILMKRVEAEGLEMRARWTKRLLPLKKIWGQMQLQFRIYVGKIERLLRHEERKKIVAQIQQVSEPQKENKINDVLGLAEQHLRLGEFDRAEESFISAIKLDATSARAYRGLADTYFVKEQFKEARETYLFLLQQLEPENDAVMVRLGELAEQENNIEEAINYYQQAVLINDALSPRFYHLAELLLKVGQPYSAKEAILSAVELEPKNPKYLDLLIETGILCNDKNLALHAYSELRLVNPDNHKLKSYKDRIYRDLGDAR